MESIYVLTFVPLFAVMVFGVEAQTSCQDLDSAACIAMAKQNSALCTDQMLAQNACPAYCKLCPLTCYNCNVTTPDVNQCNTVTCANGEVCLLKTSGAGNTNMYTMSCGPKTACPNGRKRNQKYSDAFGMQSRDTTDSVVCCDSDLCNSPAAVSPTVTTTTSTSTSSSPQSTLISGLNVTQNPYGCKRDIIIMVDKSAAMRPYFGAIQSFIISIISHLDIGTDKTRVALGLFGIAAQKRWNFDSYADKASLISAVNSIYVNHWALYANNLAAVESILHYFYQGNRPSVPDVVILISEGHSFHFFSQNKEDVAIQSLHQMSNDVISVAMGGANKNELGHISSDNSHLIYIPDSNYSNQHSAMILSNLLSLICS